MKTSTVTLQVVAQNSESMDKAKDEMDVESEKHDVEIYEGQGPDYEDLVPKLIHQDRVR